MPTFEVDVEGKTYEVDAPDTNTAWAWAYTTHRQQFGAKPAAPPEKTGMLRAAADIPVQVGRGVAVGVKALSDVFGADNPVSRAATGVEDFLGGLLSAQAKNDQAEIARIMKEAQDKGVGDQVTAAVKAFATAPVDMLSQALGTAVPVIAGGLAGSIARLGAAGVGAIGTGVGAAMGAGTVKGQIYDAVKQELLANKVPEAEAEKRAQEAQAYGGKNLDQILMGAGIGAVEAAFGAERILTGLLRKGAVKPSALPAKYRIPTAAGMEAVPEMAQAAQEQVAQNIALQREGYDVPTMRGVVGQAALEGLAGAGLGAITGAVERTEAAKPEAEARKPQEAAGPQQAEAEAPKPVTGEAGIVRPEEETPISREVAEAAEPELEPTRQIKSAELMSPPTPQEISQSAASTEQNVPSEGMVRMYHGGRGPEELTGPVWFTLDRRNAEGWAKRDPSMNVWYVDVPERVLVEQYGYATIKQARDDGYVPVPNLELPEDFAKNRKPLPLAEKKAPAPAGIEEGRAIRPEVSPEPGIAEDRQRAEPVVEAAAPEPVVTEAAAKPEEVPSAPEVVPQEEIARPVEPKLVQPKEPKTEIAEAPDTLTDEEFDQYEREQTQEAISRLSAGDYAAPRPATFVRPGMRSKVDEAMDRAAQNAYRKAVREFLQSPLTAKPPTGRGEGIDYSIYGGIDSLTDVEPRRIETKAPAAKSFQNKLEVLFKYVVPSKDMRYYLTKVMLDPEKSRMVATDGKSLVVVEDESVKQNAPERPFGVTRDKAILVNKDGTWATSDDGRPMEAIYPDVDRVIPKTDRTDAVSYNTDDFVAYAKGVEKSNKFVKTDLPLVIQIFNKQNAFDVERLVSLGEVFRRLGYKNFVVTLPNDPLDGRLMATSPDGKVKQIVMSVKYGETTGEIKRRFYKPYEPVAPKARVQPEGKGRAAVSDEEVKKPVSIKQEQTDKERQAQINRERQQAKRAAAEAERAEKERRKAEKEAEAKRKAEAAAERERAKRKAEEMEAKRKAEKEKAKREQDRRKAEEAEAKRKAAELPPYEQRVKLSADDLYPQLKDFDSAVNAIYDRASNPAEKEIASLIKSRVAQFKELGFAFSLRVTPEGKMLSSGALGHSVIKYSPIGEATTISIALNHPSNGDQSGTRWDTVTHELLHAVTQAQIRFAPEGSAARQLKSLFNDVVDYFNERAKAKTLTAFESRMYNGEINALRNPDELLAWGLSDKNMQSWLNGIDSKKGNFLSRLYDIVANVLGFGKSNTALAELLSVSEALLTEPVDAYITKANLRGKSFGMQKNVSDIPGWALSFAEGLPVVWFEKDAALIKAESMTGKTIYLVATPEGGSRGDVAGYTGNLLPPARLAEVKGIADTFRSGPEEEIRFMRSAPSPTTAGQSALDTINQLGMGVKEPEKNLYQKAKDTFKQMGESPAGTKAEIKEAVRKFFANAETKAFSADARWDSDIKNGLRKDMKPVEEIIGASLLVSQSQAVGPDGVATRAMLIGGAKYDAEVMKWVAYENKDANEIVKAKVLDDIAAKYGLTREEASQVAHTYLVAANYEGILKRNAKLEERIEKARSKAKELEDLIPILTMRYQNAIAELGEMDLEKDARRLEREFDQLNKKTKDDITKLNNEVDDLQAALVFVSEDQAAMVEPGKAIADSIPEVKKITEIWNEQRRMVKDAMVSGGLWTPEYADALMDNAAYVPFYREKQIEADEGPRVFMRGLQVKAKEQKLKGSKTAVNDVFENMALWQQYAINRAIRNHKMVQSIDVGKTIQVGDRKMAEQVSEPKRGMNVVRLWRDGKQEFYEVADPYYVEAFQSLGAVYIEPIKYFTAISNILRKTVVMYPLFSLGQLTQDSVAAIFASGLKPQYAFKIPFLAVQEFIKTMKGWSTAHNELANYGAVGVRDFNANVAKEDAEITANIKAPKGTAGKIKYMLERIAMSADNAVRQATYIAAQDAGLSKAEALEKAFEIINFRRRGSSKLLQLMGQTVPFFYAYLSAQRVAYKTLTLSGISPTERKAALETLAQTTAAVMALSFLYAMANGDDEEYKKTPATVRDRSLIIPGSGGVRIPLRPDFFLFPKVIAEHTYQLITDKGYSDGAKFRKSMADLFANAVLSPNPVPQLIKPTLEAAINYSFFDGKPIIGYFEQNKEAGRQFNESTSEFAKWLGRFGASPQMVDHLVRGYFGSVGGLVLWGTNFFIEGEPGVPRPELTAHDMLTTMPGVGAFKQKPTENALKVDFYELRDAIAKAKNTYDDMKVRSPEGLEAFLQDEKNLARLAMDKQVTKVGDHLSKIRRAIQQVAAAPAERISASEKQERIKELRDVEMELLKAVDVKAMRAQAKL